MTLVPDPSLDWKMALPPGRVEIIASDGRSWFQEGRAVPGNADNPLGWADTGAKFTECASVSARPVPAGTVTRALDLAARLEIVPDATELSRFWVDRHGPRHRGDQWNERPSSAASTAPLR